MVIAPASAAATHPGVHARQHMCCRVLGLRMQGMANPHQAALLGDDGLRVVRLRLHKQHVRKVGAARWQREAGCEGLGSVSK